MYDDYTNEAIGKAVLALHYVNNSMLKVAN